MCGVYANYVEYIVYIYLAFLQLKRKLPKTNRALAARLLEEEEEQDDQKDVDPDAQKTSTAKKASKKKKGLTSEVLEDERFKPMFNDKVFRSSMELLMLEKPMLYNICLCIRTRDYARSRVGCVF